MNRITQRTAMGLGLAIGLALCAGCGQPSAPARQVSDAWMKETRRAAAKTGGGTETKAVVADGWGNLKGRFVLQGSPPVLAPPNPTQDVAYCNEKMPRNEAIVVGAGGGLNNVVLYLRTKVTAHEDYLKPGDTLLDNKGCRFEPHVCLLPQHRTLVIHNSDTVGHNTKHPLFNEQISSMQDSRKVLDADDGAPDTVVCSIHGWMKGYLLIRRNPYMQVSQGDGGFELKNVPAGIPLEFQLWHERSATVQGTLSDVAEAGGAPTLNRGRLTIIVPKDKTASFVLTIDASTLTGG